jgi:hypothetical protein
MPWSETKPINERAKSIARSSQSDEPFSALCEDANAGVSRTNGYTYGAS